MSDSWVGGDIAGLKTMGTAYKGARGELQSLVKPLSDKVENLVSEAGWKGEAAEEFEHSWTEDSLAAHMLAELVQSVGQVLTDLSTTLEHLEGALQNAEDIAVGLGVPMGPKGVPGELMTADPPSAADAKKIKALHGYADLRTNVLFSAQEARLQAAKDLQKLYDEAVGKKKGKSPSGADQVVFDDVLRGLYAYHSERTRVKGHDAATKLDDAQKEADQASKDYVAELLDHRTAGKSLPGEDDSYKAFTKAWNSLDGIKSDIKAGETLKGRSLLPFDRAVNYKAGDLAKALKADEGLEKAPEFLKEIPVVDVAAALAAGTLEAGEDHDEGWSWTHSVVVDDGAAVGGLAAGTAVGAAAATAFSLGPGAAVGVGAAAVVGVSFVADEAVHEHWSEDIHDHGVVGGLLHGTGNVFKNTGGDFEGLAKTGEHQAKKVWHGIKSFL
ncbi:WXG100 family type VII secretion target [Streptomyces sp. DW26H14]|uniref:WXG100 family type VII secretion target n=1 Tax=Streptomyces sp. DW26H14 TaxID=3435395 RepID=UPI00403D66C8